MRPCSATLFCNLRSIRPRIHSRPSASTSHSTSAKRERVLVLLSIITGLALNEIGQVIAHHPEFPPITVLRQDAPARSEN